jgi:hypothetical protein
MATIHERLAEEVARHGAVRPPWIFAPEMSAFHIFWRMGEGEDQMRLWQTWAAEQTAAAITEVIRRYGPVPEEWAPFAAEETGVLGPHVEGWDDVWGATGFASDEVQARLATVGITIEVAPRK